MIPSCSHSSCQPFWPSLSFVSFSLVANKTVKFNSGIIDMYTITVYYSMGFTKRPYNTIEWNPSIADTMGTNNSVQYSEESMTKGFLVHFR